MRGQIRGRVVRTAPTDAPSQAVGSHCAALEWLEQVSGPGPS